MSEKGFTRFNLTSIGQNLLLHYHGDIDGNTIRSLVSLVDGKLLIVEKQLPVRKRIVNIMVEGLQNIFHHNGRDQVGMKNELRTAEGNILLTKENDHYFLTTENLIDINDTELLATKIDLVNSLDEDALRDYYEKILSEGGLTEKGGGSLGIVDMARRSGNKLEYKFLNYNETHQIFNLTVKVPY